MGYFIDEEALYDDVRAAETDHERAEALLHHMVADLDSGYEPERPDAAQRKYDEEIAPQIEDELGLETPETEVLRYKDSEQLAYDVVTSLANTPLGEFYGKTAEQMLPENTGVIGGITTKASNEVNAAALTKLARGMSKRISGIMDPYATSLSGEETEQETIAYNLPGVHKMADKVDKEPEEVLDYVLTHEGIHTVQSVEHQPTVDARRESVEDIVALMDNPEEMMQDAGSIMEMPSMTMIEGHAEFYTDRVCEDDIHSQASEEGPETLAGYILSIIMAPKKRQYEQGAEFFETLHDRGGDEYVQYAMNHPPDSMDVFEQPDAWADHIEEQLE